MKRGLGGSALVGLTALLLMGQSSSPVLMASGKIVSIDPKEKAISLKSGLTEHRFLVEADTKISDGQKPIKLEQLQPGTTATVEYVQERGKSVALSIKVESSAAETESPAKAPAPAGPEREKPARP